MESQFSSWLGNGDSGFDLQISELTRVDSRACILLQLPNEDEGACDMGFSGVKVE